MMKRDDDFQDVAVAEIRGSGMNEGWRHSREALILLTERWVGEFQKRGAKWGIHPADLVGLIMALIEAKELLDEVKQGGGAAALMMCDEAVMDMKRKAVAIKKHHLLVPPLTTADLAVLAPFGGMDN
jgi:hypothetical protein